MKTVKNSDGRKRGRAVAKSKRLPRVYVALHSTQLARCLAHGLIFVPAKSTLRSCAAPAPAEYLEEARQGLGYGSVVLVEFEAGDLGFDQARNEQETDLAGYREVPLAWVVRVVFRSHAERDDFVARASTYEDVPVAAVEYRVDATLFGARSLLGGLVTSGNGEQVSTAALQVSTAIEKVSGVIAAVLASFRWGRATSKQVDTLHVACVAAGGKGAPPMLMGNLASAIDNFPTSNFGTALAGVAATILASAGASTGFDVDTFLAELCRQATAGGLDAEMLDKFETRAAAVLSGATELRDDAFTDAEGKIALRALLLFMLNPEVEALQKIRERMGSVGHGVFTLACALAGCHAGISRLSVSTKAPSRTVFVGTTLLAWKICLGQPLDLEQYSAWTQSGSCENTLGVAGFLLASTGLPAQEKLTLLKTALGSMGIDSAFEVATGALTWRGAAGKGPEFYAFSSKSPSLPRVDAIDICIHLEKKVLSKGGTRLAADASLSVRETGVFARQSIRAKNKGLELRVCCVGEKICPAIINAASEVLLAQAKNYEQTTPGSDGSGTLGIGPDSSGAAVQTGMLAE